MFDKLRLAELVQQVYQVCRNVIFSDAATGNPKVMSFTELDSSMRRRDA